MSSLLLCLLSLLLFPASVSAACEVLPNDSRCSCQFHDGKNIINCKREGLDEVPQFNEVTQVYDELTLSQNSIRQLQDNDFAGLKVRKLDLSRNDVTTIQASAFAGLNSHLRELILDVVSLGRDQFPTEALSALTDLEILTLRGFRMATFPNAALAQLSSLRELHMHECGLQEIEDSDMQAQRNTLEVLDLESNEFQRIPAAVDTLLALDSLMLTSNQLTVLPSNAFQGVSALRELDLSQNSIKQVQADAFKGLEAELQVLRMHHCQLAKQQMALMKGLRSLLELDLSHNDIDGIEDGFFNQMSLLQTVSLASNDIESVSASTWDGLHNSLQSLNLESNMIGSIQARSFASFRSLETLLLSYQSRSVSQDLDDQTFVGIEDTLQTLGLAAVGFTDSDWISVNGLRQLRNLDLKSNDISNVPDSTFLEMPQLRTVQLSDNDLQTLTQRGMRGLENSLETLRLDNNDISVINHCVFAEFQSLTSLDLHSNPLQCDCQLRWLREWTEQLTEQDKESIAWECSSPPVYDGTKFINLDSSNFICSGDDQLLECEDLTPTTTTNEGAATPPEAPQIIVEMANFTATTVRLSWTVAGGQDITGFRIKYFIIGQEENTKYEEANQYARNYYLSELEPDASYLICVGALHSSLLTVQGEMCMEARTEPTPEAVKEETNNTAIIVAAILGAIFVIAVVVIIVCLVKRCSRQPEDDLAGFSMADAPKLGYNSKRFSKPKPQSLSTQNLVDGPLDKRLEGFTPEERDRIINLLTHSGASTLSMISNTDSQRYVPEPPPVRPQGGADGYMNPADIKADENFYFEIPDDDDNYDQIPGDRERQQRARPPSLSTTVYI